MYPSRNTAAKFGGYTTEELACSIGHKPQTLRAAFCTRGNWCGIVPKKLPNRRLLWPADSIARLENSSAVEPAVLNGSAK